MHHRHLLAILCLILLGLGVGACTKCGPIWEDWQPRACHSDAPR